MHKKRPSIPNICRTLWAVIVILLLAPAKSVKAQVSIQRSFYVEDSIDHTPLGFALIKFTKIGNPVPKTMELRANSAGIIELTGILAKDSIAFTIELPGYQSYRGRCLAKDLYLRHIPLQSDTHELHGVTVHADSRRIRFKPAEMRINWNKFTKSPSEPLASVIKRVPTIINKSPDKNTLSLQTGGGKKIAIFLDGRKLSDQEVQSLPAMMIAKASLVTFPSVLDAADNTAILYLSSNMFAYNYSFDEINLNYDIGRTGPSFTFRHTQKKGLWSNNVFINGYHYKMPESYTNINIDGQDFQRDTSKSSVNTLLIMASLTKKSVKNNLFTIGVLSNLFKGGSDSRHLQNDNTSSVSSFSSHGNNTLINATLYAAWRNKAASGNTWQLHASSTFQPNSKSDYQQKTPTSIYSSTNTQEQLYALSGRYLLKKTKLGDLDWSSSFSLGAKASFDKTANLFNQNTNPATSIQSSQQYATYGGVSSAITGEKLKIEGSLLGNYAWQKGYSFTHFSNGYIYPKLVFSYAPDDKQSISLSLTATTLRPSFKMAVTDSSYSNNWMISKGNQGLRTEHNYHLDLLYNLSLRHFTFEAEGEQIYYNNGIVQVWDLQKTPVIQLTSSYQNLNYIDRSLSVTTSYDLGDALYLTWSGQLHHLSFKQKELPADFQNGYYLSSQLNINYYSKHAGNYALIGSWDGNPLTYLKQSKTHPELNFNYDYDLTRTLNISAGLYDILGTGGWRKVVIYNRYNQLTDANKRTFSLGLTWKFGQLFGNTQAGSVNSAAVPNDTKKL
ncbi:Outer membrane receptor proteins, mostly Fe transport [Arachidicoccus rhizosphaerae]|uniref:Outer membrane receptor proteins, mostly Fe transport n=1 Tax=Arachidicoccus rhizosphaerae TaxID=551991 RepID=A0A1H4BW90_9BACT|nr:TonB-dependent receptor [Arachidicoccus rhizosphaerae]SEA52398.1 Outer membrane receptor proteins, mostly Fe transport [Arachidicoccus rhizosphaerae]